MGAMGRMGDARREARGTTAGREGNEAEDHAARGCAEGVLSKIRRGVRARVFGQKQSCAGGEGD